MKATFESDDPKEIYRLAKSLSMALVLWEIVHNTKRSFPEDYDYEPFLEKITDLLYQHGIIIDDLIE